MCSGVAVRLEQKGRLYSLSGNLMMGTSTGGKRAAYLIGGGGWYRFDGPEIFRMITSPFTQDSRMLEWFLTRQPRRPQCLSPR